jgi:hypothetical protein
MSVVRVQKKTGKGQHDEAASGSEPKIQRGRRLTRSESPWTHQTGTVRVPRKHSSQISDATENLFRFFQPQPKNGHPHLFYRHLACETVGHRRV